MASRSLTIGLCPRYIASKANSLASDSVTPVQDPNNICNSLKLGFIAYLLLYFPPPLITIHTITNPPTNATPTAHQNPISYIIPAMAPIHYKMEPVSNRLRDLIRRVRGCKTAAEERAVVQKESADIRVMFADESCKLKHRCVVKLIFIQMMGYPTQFGQMECIKLLVSQNFIEKRVGYLGLTQLLNEQTDLVMMVTNSMRADLMSKDSQISNLALTALANIGTVDMCRDLSEHVLQILLSGSAHSKKRAALAAVRIIRKCPEHIEDYIVPVPKLLEERNHGVVLSSVVLLTEILKQEPERATEFRRIIQVLVRILRNLLLSGYSAEHDVQGITDPFLQVSVLRLLGFLGKSDVVEDMSDSLAQVATNTEGAKNVGNAVLYECVKVILLIKATGGLRVLATNILGRFLTHRDNNIRYVSLKSLAQLSELDISSVQRHKNIIVDCLKDQDAVIRKKALELIFAIINENNLNFLVQELIIYLPEAQPDVRPDLATKICGAIEKFCADPTWYVDTLINVLQIAGNYVAYDSIPLAINTINANKAIQQYATVNLYNALAQCPDQFGLMVLGVWCIGEYGQMLVGQTVNGEIISAQQVLSMFEQLIANFTDTISKEYILNALIKLSARLPQNLGFYREVFQKYTADLDPDVQQRACEYTHLLESRWDALRAPLLEPMPPLIKSQPNEREAPPAPEVPKSKEEQINLLDLDDIFTPGPPQKTDLIEIFHPPSDAFDEFVDAEEPPNITQQIFQDSDISVTISCNKDVHDSSTTYIEATFANTTSFPLTEFKVMGQAHKHLKLQIFATTSSFISPGAHLVQSMKVINSMHGSKGIVIRLKVEFMKGGEKVVKTVMVDSIPVGF